MRHPLGSQGIAAMKMVSRQAISRSLCFGFEADLVTEAFYAALEGGNGAGLADLVEIGFSEVAVVDPRGQHVVGGDEDLVGNGESCAHGTPASLQAVILVLEIAAPCSGCGDCRADCALSGRHPDTRPRLNVPAASRVEGQGRARRGRRCDN